jgi:plasmid stabilization system protein ParE
MVRVIWSRDAIDDVEAIRNYIAEFNPGAGDQLAARLIAAGNSLTNFPDRGRPASGGCREYVALSPYLIRYEFESGFVSILRIRHSARLFDEA